MIGITLGEYFGIGPEILLKTYADLGSAFPPCRIYGSSHLLETTAKSLHLPKFWEDPSFEVIETFDKEFSVTDKKNRAQYVLSTLDQSIQDAVDGSISSIVTCPIDKLVIQCEIPTFSGHTEYLAEKSGSTQTIMMLDNKEFSIALLTNHVSLRNVSTKLSSASVEQTIQVAASSMSKHFEIKNPKIALLGLNPHAGEIDEQAEEKLVFLPAIEKLKLHGIHVHGPFPADSFFPKARLENWDLILSPYHDQGLVAAKYNGLENVINVTLGMPFLRISPGHGVAYDLVGKNKADHRSFKRALLAAQKQSLDV